MEVAWKGLGVGCRFFSMVGAMGIPCFILNPMIRTLALERGHVSPLELLQDRYRSHMLSVLVVGVMVTSLIIGCGTQLLAMKMMLLTLTNDISEANAGTFLACAVAALCDVFGGFRGVSRIDTTQMYVSIAAGVGLALLVVSEWGGVEGVGPAECAAAEPEENEFQAQSLMCQLNVTGVPCVNGCAGTCVRSEPIECGQIADLAGSSNWTFDSDGRMVNARKYALQMFTATENASGVAQCTFCKAFDMQCSGCYGSAWIFDAQSTVDGLGSRNSSTATVDFAALVRQPHAWQGDYGVWKVFGLVLLVSVGGHGGSVAPHIFQRVVSAASDKTHKLSLLPVFPIGWLMTLSGLLYGVTWMALHGPEFNFADDGTVLPGATGLKQPLAGIFDDMIDLGGTRKLFGLVALSGTIASLLTAACMTSMGCGSMIAVGIYRNVLWPIMQWGDVRGDLMTGASEDGDSLSTGLTLDSQTVILSKIISTISLLVALATIALSDDADLSELFDWTVGLSAHGAPAVWYSGANVFYLGRRVHSISLILGLVFGLLGTVIIQFYILSPDENGQVPELVLPAVAWGVLINYVFTIWFILTLPGSLADSRQNRPRPSWLQWDTPTPDYLRKYGKNFLSFNEAERICTKRSIPSHRTPAVIAAMVAWVVTVATLPWFDGGGESAAAGLYKPPVPDSDEYVFGLPWYTVVQIGGALVTLPIYVGLNVLYWDASEIELSGKLGAVNLKHLDRMTVQDVSKWLFDFHQDQRPQRDENGRLQNMAWGLVLDHYIGIFRLNKVDGHTLKQISGTKLQAVSQLVDTYGIVDQEHAMCIANQIHILKDDGWLVGDAVYSREWETKLRRWSADPLDCHGCATVLTVKSLDGPKTMSSREVKRQSVADGDGFFEGFASVDEGNVPSPGLSTNYSVGRLVSSENDLATNDADYGDRANPLPHGYSRMYLRWDPYATDRASVLGESAWTNALNRLRVGNAAKNVSWSAEKLALLDVEDATARAMFLMAFEKVMLPWLRASNHVVPWTPDSLQRHNLTSMLHSKATKRTSSTCDHAIPSGWAVRGLNVDIPNRQGRLSRTCMLQATYHDQEGASKPGPRNLFAKFLPKESEFLKFRRDHGVGGYNVFATEVFVYEHELMKDFGLPQPKSFFEAHDPQLDCFCILMDDLRSAGFRSGDELSELGDTDGKFHDKEGSFLPNICVYAELVRVLADFSSRRFNTSQGTWRSPHNSDHNLSEILLGFDSRDYLAVMYRNLHDHFSVPENGEVDRLFNDIGFKELCAWLGYTTGVERSYTSRFEKGVLWMMENQELFALASRGKENGGWLDCGIVHGDFRIDNIWLPTPLQQGDAGYDQTDRSTLQCIDGHPFYFTDFQHVKRGCFAYDLTVFLAHSVPTAWRRENEMQLLSLYLDAIKASPGYSEWLGNHPGEELTWEMLLLQVQFCLFHYMPSLIVFGATSVVPFEAVDPQRFFGAGTVIRRFLDMCTDWSPKPKKKQVYASEEDNFQYLSPIQIVIEAAAQRSRDVEEELARAGSSGQADWAALRNKWKMEAIGQGEYGILPLQKINGQMSTFMREEGVQQTERFSVVNQDTGNTRDEHSV